MDVGRRLSSSGGKYVERKASVSPYMSTTSVPGRHSCKRRTVSVGTAPPVLVT